jgi:anthranilate phosphoribosyltransferase
VADVNAGSVSEYTIDPGDFGLDPAPLAGLGGGEPAENAELIRGILDGSEQGAPRSATILNAAAALLASGLAEDFQTGAEDAAESIDSGAAQSKLDQLVALSA